MSPRPPTTPEAFTVAQLVPDTVAQPPRMLLTFVPLVSVSRGFAPDCPSVPTPAVTFTIELAVRDSDDTTTSIDEPFVAAPDGSVSASVDWPPASARLGSVYVFCVL